MKMPHPVLAMSVLIHLTATMACAGSVDFGGLLAEMLDRPRIAEFPDPAFVCKQASSYNRRSKTPGTPEWFSTDDYSQFLGCDKVNGRREWIMMDVTGPGAIVRWWITQYKFDGTIRIYLDGSDEPVLEGKGNELIGGKKTLKPGRSIARDVSGGGAVCLLRVNCDARDIEQAMRSTVIRADFDGKQRVWAPVGGFFGSGPGLNPFKGWWRQVRKGGWMTCWWPMPFKKTAVVAITNHGTSDVTVALGDIGVADWTWTNRTMYFHSSWRGDDHIAVFGNDYIKGEEWNYVTVRGKGVYVGDTLAVFNRPLKPRLSWWGEGDEKIYVDGELFPSHFGTGTEDYFGYAWGTAAPFEAPFHAQPRGDANKGPGHTTNTRTRMLDRIPFQKSFKMNMELMHWRSGGTIDYATTTYWYARDGGGGNGQTSPARVRRKVGQTTLERQDK